MSVTPLDTSCRRRATNILGSSYAQHLPPPLNASALTGSPLCVPHFGAQEDAIATLQCLSPEVAGTLPMQFGVFSYEGD